MPTFAGNRRSLAYIVLSNNRTQNCATDRQTEEQNSDRHTYEIIYVRFRRYVCISFANFLLRKKYIAQLNYNCTRKVLFWGSGYGYYRSLSMLYIFQFLSFSSRGVCISVVGKQLSVIHHLYFIIWTFLNLKIYTVFKYHYTYIICMNNLNISIP